MRTGSSPSIRFSAQSDRTWTAILTSPARTASLGRAIGQHLQGNEVVLLIGELGAGKTLLVRGVAEGNLIAPESVSSPTFTLIQEYRGKHGLIHADLYRLESAEAITDLGLDELFDGTRVVIIEWADRLPPTQLPADCLTVHLHHRGRQSRLAELTAAGPVSLGLCHRMLRDFRCVARKTPHPSGKAS